MAEKFCLKWNDFQNNVSQSFGILRTEKEFFNVTLISEDESQFEAHKLVLAACSPFFKRILKNTHSLHPILYLSGVHSTILKSILDFIYNGEASMEQEHLEQFLTASQKLRLKGLLLSSDEDVSANEVIVSDPESIQAFQNINFGATTHQNIVEIPKKNSMFRPSNDQAFAMKPAAVKSYKIDQPTESELDEKISNMISRQEFSKKYQCHVCCKTLSDRTSAIFHSETHFPDLVYNCDLCNKTAKSRNGLRQHKATFHKESIQATRMIVSPLKKENVVEERLTSFQHQKYIIPNTTL